MAGKIGSGKSSVTEILAAFGYQVVNVDQLGHRALVTERDRIINVLGSDVLGSDGQIDRGHLGSLVFGNAEARSRLDEIVHPVMVSRVRTLVEVESGDLVIDAALLIPMGLDVFCDLVLWVRAPSLLRLYRVVVDGKRITTVLGAMWAQRGRRLKRPTTNVDTRSVSRRTIYNLATRGLLRRRIGFILGRRR